MTQPLRAAPYRRRRMLGPLLLALSALLLAPAVQSERADPAGPGRESAEAVLQHFSAHGFASPLLALERLQQAVAPGPQASLERRWRFETALSQLALAGGQEALARASTARLQAWAEQEACRPCEQVLQLRRLQLDKQTDSSALRQSLEALLALPVPEDPALRVEWLLARAAGHSNLDAYEPAIADALLAYEAALNSQRRADQVSALEHLGLLNSARRDLARAEDYNRQAIALAREIGFQFRLVRLLFNQSYVLAQHKEPRQQQAERKALLVEMLARAEATRGLEYVIPNALINLAALSNDLGEHRQAAAYASRAQQRVDAAQDPNGLAFALVNGGVAAVHLGRAEDGLALVQRAVEIGQQTGDKRELADLIEQQVNALEAAGRSAAALQALRRWVELHTELTRSQREQVIAQLQESVAAQQRQREIERLRLEQVRSEAELQLRSWRERAWAAAALIVALLAFITWQRLSRSRRINRSLRKDMAKLSDESQHDALTGAHNRRFGEALLQGLAADNAARPAAQAPGVALLLLDADHFKRVNDQHGHAAGDAVLIELTRRLQAMLRDGDAVVRWGGEEFLLVLPRTEEAGLRALAPRVLAAIGSAAMLIGADKRLPVRVSAGGVIWHAGHGPDWPALLALADAALYRAKAEGRNRAVCAWVEGGFEPRDAEQLDAAVQQGRVRLETVLGVALPG